MKETLNDLIEVVLEEEIKFKPFTQAGIHKILCNLSSVGEVSKKSLSGRISELVKSGMIEKLQNKIENPNQKSPVKMVYAYKWTGKPIRYKNKKVAQKMTGVKNRLSQKEDNNILSESEVGRQIINYIKILETKIQTLSNEILSLQAINKKYKDQNESLQKELISMKNTINKTAGKVLDLSRIKSMAKF